MITQKEQDEMVSKEVAYQFIDAFRKTVLHVTTHMPEAFAELKKKHKGQMALSDPGHIAGRIAFFSMGKLLHERPTITVGELAKELPISSATASRLVDWWVKHGLAERLHDFKDKRLVLVRITEDGKRFNEIMDEIAVISTETFLGKLNLKERILLNSLLKKLVSNSAK